MEISHKEFITILKEKDKYEKMKENVKDLSEKLEEKQENMKVDSVNSKKKDEFVTDVSAQNKKLSKKQLKIIKHLCHQNRYFFL